MGGGLGKGKMTSAHVHVTSLSHVRSSPRIKPLSTPRDKGAQTRVTDLVLFIFLYLHRCQQCDIYDDIDKDVSSFSPFFHLTSSPTVYL